jgi:ribonuclease G
MRKTTSTERPTTRRRATPRLSAGVAAPAGLATKPKSQPELEILVSAAELESRAALRENGKLIELKVEREPKLVGNIYKGRVTSVVPGMEAAFVDIGLSRNAFLPAADFPEPEAKPRRRSIAERLQVGAEMLVQVIRAPVGSKGARVTSRLSLPGRYLVYLPAGRGVGVSVKIQSERERERLRKAGELLKVRDAGVIVRTEAQGKSAATLKRELSFLSQLWERIKEKAQQAQAPALLHEELPVVFQFLRDTFSRKVSRVVVYPETTYREVLDQVGLMAPHLRSKVALHEGPLSPFVERGLEEEIDKLLRRKVWLEGGGHITIDQTEALTAIDVNTGRYTGGADLEQTILHTNMQAAAEVGRQIRLRDIGGIVLIDFIDMRSSRHRSQVMRAFQESLKGDRSKIKVLQMSQLGVVQLTREKSGASLREVFMETCASCGGTGMAASALTIALRIETQLAKAALKSPRAVIVRASVQPAAYLVGPAGDRATQMERNFGFHLYIRASPPAGGLESFEVFPATPAEVGKQIKLYRPGQRVQAEAVEAPQVSEEFPVALANGYFVGVPGSDLKPGAKLTVKLAHAGRNYGEGTAVS